jgi:hypothetical protein
MERPLIPVRGALIIPEIRPEWRNWQTRQVEGLVPVMGVQVQVLSPALYLALSRYTLCPFPQNSI